MRWHDAMRGWGWLAASTALAMTQAGCFARSPVRAAQAIAEYGVFEVVTPKAENPAIQYKTPLPVERLPFRARSDKFHAVGSAFAISPTHFVTAAHVLGWQRTLRQGYFLRDSAGRVFPIDRIVKYSQYRDVVELELAAAPPAVRPIPIREDVAVGESVATVGNAHGQGNVARAGYVVSFTSEEREGAWRFIRFTAPASPGNSGGPLIDSAGNAVGVVLRKSAAENLNYALPIVELRKLPADKSEFYQKAIPITEPESDKKIHVDWRFASPLPASLLEVRSAASSAFEAFISQSLDRFVESNRAELFPQHPRLPVYGSIAWYPFGFGIYRMDHSQHWSVEDPKLVEKELSNGQTAWYVARKGAQMGVIVLERPGAIPLQQFYQSPKLVADAIIELSHWSRPYAGERVAVATFGEPAQSTPWVDQLSRPWVTHVWYLYDEDASLVVHCLPAPMAVGCIWMTGPVAGESLASMSFKRMAPRLTFDFYGRVSDWGEYLALPETFKPKLFTTSQTTVKLDEQGALAISLGDYHGTVRAPGLDANSLLHVFTGVDLDDPPALRNAVTVLYVRPRSDKPSKLELLSLLEPGAHASAKSRDKWQKLSTAQAPWDNTVTADGERNLIMRATLKPRASKPTMAIIYKCWNGKKDDKAELEATCADFQRSMSIGD